MASSSGSGRQLARLVVLPGEDADVIEDLVCTATSTNSKPHSSRPTGGEASEQLRISPEVVRQEMESHGSVLEVLTDAVTSEDHVWQFLDVLGRRMSGHLNLEGSLRGLLLLHGFLRTCTPQRERETAHLLLWTHDRSGRPSLDLLHLSKTLLSSSTSSSSSSSSSSSQAHGAATAAGRAYAKLLLQRIACTQCVPLSGCGSTTKQSSQQQQQEQRQEGAGNPAAASAATATGRQSGSDLGAQYWAQLGAADLTKQIQALQQLQECVVQSGNACVDWVVVATAREASGKDTGAVGVMHVVLENLLQDSFVLFSAINYGLMELIDRLGKISKDQALEALQVCRTSAAHGKALSDLYVRLGSLQVGHGVAFPSVEVIGDAYLSSLEQYVDSSTAASRVGTMPGTPHSLSRLPSTRHALPNTIVLFAPSGADTPAPPHTAAPKSLATPANAGPPPPSPVQIAAQLQFEATAQALFGSQYNPRQSSTQQPLLALPAPGQAPSHPSNAHSTTAAGPAPGKAVWELALEASLGSPTGAAAAMAGGGGGGGGGGPASPGFSSSLASSGDALHPSQSILHMPPLTEFGGGLDQLLLDSLYEAAEAQRAAYKAMAAAAHYQSNPHLWAGSVPPPAVASAGSLLQQGSYAPQQGQGPYPLLQQQHGAVDPFAASAACAPPAYVQMAVRARQQLAMELERRMMAKHAQFSAYLQQQQQQQQQQQMVPSWGGVGVQYGNVVVPY